MSFGEREIKSAKKTTSDLLGFVKKKKVMKERN